MGDPDYKALMVQALGELKTLKARVRDLEAREYQPIAIVGLGCRFPGGGESPDAFWRVLRDGIDTVGETPADRWDLEAFYDADPETPGKTPVRNGAFLERVDMFDPEFFGIAPREAKTLDPQHRLLLEVSWEALENAGYAPDQFSGEPVGAFLGLMNQDYAHRQTESQSLDPYLVSGNDLSFASGRLSYTLGLRGPSMVVATACSSSLVAAHLACQALRNHECDVALAGGVNVILRPHTNVILSKLGALANDGRSKTFDASADGYGRGEGCGIVVLKRLNDAVADGDRVMAVIRGSAVNHGGPSTGLTVPSGDAQEAVLRQAIAAARVDPAEIDFVEAHGAGTVLGDPIELRALVNVMGAGRTAPLLVGSVKTNVGHLEAAAGVVSLIKVILALQHRAIPPSLHLTSPNPHVPWDEIPVKVPTELTEWPDGRASPIAGVSSFGLSGVNAHMIVEAATPQPRLSVDVERPQHILSISAKTDLALQALSAAYVGHFRTHPDLDLADVCFTANTGRAQFKHRLSVVAASLDGALEMLCTDPSHATSGVRTGAVPKGGPPKVAFLFPGLGAEYAGMGRELYRTQPTFRRAVDRCGVIVSAAMPQAALFALEFGLAELWRSWNVTPDVVMGHGVGEYVAACVAGVLELEDALMLACDRRDARQLRYLKPHVAWVSSVTGRLVGEEVATPDYWTDLSARPTAFAQGIASLEQRGVSALVEIGPQSTLLDKGRACWPGSDVAWLASLAPDSDWTAMLTTLSELYVRGVPVSWKGFEQDYAHGRRRLALPTYAFQRRRFWALDRGVVGRNQGR